MTIVRWPVRSSPFCRMLTGAPPSETEPAGGSWNVSAGRVWPGRLTLFIQQIKVYAPEKRKIRMTERKKSLITLAGLLLLLVLFYSRVLFTDRIIRAPDIINEYYWSALEFSKRSFLEFFKINLTATWDIFTNSGNTTEGGTAGAGLQFLQLFVYYFFPLPSAVAWHIVLHFFLGGSGVYMYCRLTGAGRLAAFTGGMIFALSPEMASLINAGHVMKIATICMAPWVFYFFEKGFLTRRLVYFLATGVVLAFQFFYTHWQISYYTCLALGVYGIIRFTGYALKEWGSSRQAVMKMFMLCLATMIFFLSTVAISLAPLKSWSESTNRGSQSGANQGKGGLAREEAMLWSMPPEETAAFVIPGLFGMSRQEAGPNPAGIRAFYWGRMTFTQTISYMGLLPWLLVPLPLIFRRDRYAWLAVVGITGGVLFSMGQYTPFYNLLYDYFPGINRFRVPKMMMFIPVISLGVLAARGIDLLMDAEIRGTRAFRRYRAGVAAVPVALLIFLGILRAGKDTWIALFFEMLSQPTRYEQGMYLIAQRWNNLMLETGIAAVLAALCAGAINFGFRSGRTARFVPLILVVLYVGDVWRVNDKFMFLVNAPEQGRSLKTPVMEYLARDSNQYRTLPMDGSDPSHYTTFKIPVMFASNPVQLRRWQELLDNFSINSSMPDMLNVKYLVYGAEQYAQERGQLSDKYRPVFRSPDGQQILLENLAVLPKAWLVPAVVVVENGMYALQVLQNPAFNPAQAALVESPPPIDLATINQQVLVPPGNVSVTRYEGERIEITASPQVNSLLVLGEKYYKGWKATVDGRPADIYPVNHVLRGVYLTPGKHSVEFRFDPLPFKIGKYMTLVSFAVFAGMLIREWLIRRGRGQGARLDNM